MGYVIEGEDKEDRDADGGCSRWHCSWGCVVGFCTGDFEELGFHVKRNW